MTRRQPRVISQKTAERDARTNAVLAVWLSVYATFGGYKQIVVEYAQSVVVVLY
jgi:hypothetical protein